MSHGKKITAKDALTLPNGSVCDRGAGWQRIIKTAGRWSSVDSGSAVDSFPDNCTLSFCPDPNWKPEGEKVVEEYFVNVYEKGTDIQGVLAHDTIEYANERQREDRTRIAILHVRDGVAELLDTEGKAMQNDRLMDVTKERNTLEAERDRLAAQVVSLKADRDKVCEANADLLAEVANLKADNQRRCMANAGLVDELRRWRAEAMAGQRFLKADGSLRDDWAGVNVHRDARAAYAHARAANEQVSKPAELTITDNATKPDGGPDALIFGSYRDDCAYGPFFSMKEMKECGVDYTGHITLTPGADGVVRWKWTAKP